MPIDYKKYPANWKTEIRPAILERANNCCEFCGVQNYDIVLRGDKNVKIVLTIAHLDHNIGNNELLNLRALCQKCHLTYDIEHHKRNSRLTFKNKKGLIELEFFERSE